MSERKQEPPVLPDRAYPTREIPGIEPPIPEKTYPVIDTDLGRDNVENDVPEADREDL